MTKMNNQRLTKTNMIIITKCHWLYTTLCTATSIKMYTLKFIPKYW